MSNKLVLNFTPNVELGELFRISESCRLKITSVEEDMNGDAIVTFTGIKSNLEIARRKYLKDTPVGLKGEQLEKFIIEEIEYYPITEENE